MAHHLNVDSSAAAPRWSRNPTTPEELEKRRVWLKKHKGSEVFNEVIYNQIAEHGVYKTTRKLNPDDRSDYVDFWDWSDEDALTKKVKDTYQRLLESSNKKPEYTQRWVHGFADKQPIIDPFLLGPLPLPLPKRERDRFLSDHHFEIRDIPELEYGLCPAEIDHESEIFYSLMQVEDLWRGSDKEKIVKLNSEYQTLILAEYSRRFEEIKTFRKMFDAIFDANAKEMKNFPIEAEIWIYTHLLFVNEIWRLSNEDKILYLRSTYSTLLVELESRQEVLVKMESDMVQSFPADSNFAAYHEENGNIFWGLIYVNRLWPKENRKGIISAHYLAHLRYRDFIRQHFKLKSGTENWLIQQAMEVSLELDPVKALQFFEKALRKSTLEERRKVLKAYWQDVRSRVCARNMALLEKDSKLVKYYSLVLDDFLFDHFRADKAGKQFFDAYFKLLSR